MKTALRLVAAVVLLAVIGGIAFYLNPLWFADRGTRFKLWREGVKSEYVEVDGYRLHYLEAGPATGTPLVLIHGLGSRAEDWAALIPGLAAQGFHLYVPDLLGYGRSPKPNVDYSIALETKTVAGFMQAVKVPRADVGGWSMGGWVAMKLALDHPEMVQRLVIYDSAGVYFPATFGPELFVPHDVAGLRHLMSVLSPKPIPLPGFAERAALEKLQRNGWVVTRSMAAMTSGRDILDFKLYAMQPPMLIVWGKQDELIPLSVGEKIHEKVPGSVLDVVDGCGHLAPAECAKPVLEATVEFLKSEPVMRGGGREFPVEAQK
jgi:pimeloyl-ACP methyl ester carboxylesterase